eukprot:3691502-Amphidinium_carterae.1
MEPQSLEGNIQFISRQTFTHTPDAVLHCAVGIATEMGSCIVRNQGSQFSGAEISLPNAKLANVHTAPIVRLTNQKRFLHPSWPIGRTFCQGYNDRSILSTLCGKSRRCCMRLGFCSGQRLFCDPSTAT